MANQPHTFRSGLELEYRTWAQICLDKHGQPWPIADADVKDATEQELQLEIKRLKTLGRTPHEG